MQTFKLLLISAVIVIMGLLAFAYSGIYNVAADSGHSGPVAWFMQTVRERSIAVRAADLVVPAGLDEHQRIAAGAGHYKDMCAGCHGFPGRQPSSAFGPAPPALYEHAVDADEAFWVIRHGIKMTAMPSHLDHSDQENWDTVAFVRALPEMTPDDYQAITADAEHSHDDQQSHEHQPAGEEHSADHSGEHAADPDDANSGHQHAAAPTPAATIDAFHHALQEGDGQQAQSYLHPAATMLEGGTLQSAQSYASGHMQGDMRFLAAISSEILARDQQASERQATIITQRRMTGQFNDRDVDLLSTETATLAKAEQGWQITHLNWVSRPFAESGESTD